jgi:hypothetical protein
VGDILLLDILWGVRGDRDFSGDGMKKIICVDFDGTVVEHKYPDVGRDVPDAVRVLQLLQEYGVKLILWTMRSGEFLQDAVNWFAENDIALWGVNENPEQKEWTDSPKAYAPLYIDDAALGCPLTESKEMGARPYVDWVFVEIELERKGFLPERITTFDKDPGIMLSILKSEGEKLGIT